MSWIISKNNDSYVKFDPNKKETLTRSISLAEEFTTELSAQAYINNCTKPQHRKFYKVIEMKSNDTANVQKCNAAVDNKISLDLHLEIEDIDILDTFMKMQIILSQVKTYDQLLQHRINQIEKEDCDIRHKIEFPKDNGKEFNAAELAQFSKIFRDVLRKRRKAKDNVFINTIIMESSLEDFKSGRVVNRIKGLNNREYTPRKLTELFTG